MSAPTVGSRAPSERDLADDRLAVVERERDGMREDLARLEVERDGALALVASVARSNWIVARDGGRDCIDCGREIRRGEAYELRPGVDELAHIHCPTENRG